MDEPVTAAQQATQDQESGTQDTNQKKLGYDPGKGSLINNAPVGGLGAVAARARKAKADAAKASGESQTKALDALKPEKKPQ